MQYETETAQSISQFHWDMFKNCFTAFFCPALLISLAFLVWPVKAMAAWQSTTVDDTAVVGWYTSIVLDSSDIL